MRHLYKLIFLVFTFFVFCSGQNYIITDFIPDSLTTWQVFGSGHFSTSASNFEEEYSNSSGKGYSYSLQPNGYFYYKRIRPYLIQNYMFHTKFKHNNSSNSNKDSNNKIKSSTINFTSHLNNVKYFKNKLGVVGNFDFSFDYNKYENNNTNKDTLFKNITNSSSKGPRFNFSVQTGLSFGRLYSGKYSSKASELLHEIDKNGLLKRELTNSEYLSLSQIILEKQTRYHFDDRIKKFEALETIINYLHGIDVISNNFLLPTLIIEDLYSYDLIDEIFPRQFGFEFFCLGQYRYSNHYSERLNLTRQYDILQEFLNSKTKNIYQINNNNFYKGIKLGINYSKIFNWNLFYNISLSAQYDYRFGVQKSTHKDYLYNPEAISKYYGNEDYKTDFLSFSINTDFYYQYNSRSYFKLNNLFRYYHNPLHNYNSSEYNRNKEIESFTLIINPGYVYFISPKVRFSAGISFGYLKDWENKYYDSEKQNKTDINSSLSMGIQYYL